MARWPPRCAASSTGARLVAVISILEDKDGVLGELLPQLAPLCEELALTRTANPRTLPPATLASLARQWGRASGRASSPTRMPHWTPPARPAGPGGVVLATGSLYLLADLLRPRGARGSVL